MDLNLRERTALIRGPFSSTVQGMVMGLTQEGANCVLLDTVNEPSIRFCSQISDAREGNPKLGRALSIKNPLKTDADVKEAISQAVQPFGSIDLFIDAQMSVTPNKFKVGEPLAHIDDEIHQNLKISIQLAHSALAFFKARRRGRVLFLMNEKYADPIAAAARGALLGFAQNLAPQTAEYNATINLLCVGMTEEWILSQHPQTPIKEALEKMRQTDPLLKITEPDKIMNTTIYLLSQAGLAINGQYIKLS